MKKQTVYFLKGLPGSGKSFWAKEKIESDRHNGHITKRVNKDDLRAMLDNTVYSKRREEFILKLRDYIVYETLANDDNIIIDDTNFNPKHSERIKEIISECIEIGKSCYFNRRIEFVEKFFDTPLQECINRDSKRENPVGQKVILDMYNRYLRNTKYEVRPYNPDLPDCIIVDIDGTLALHENRRSPFDYWKAGEDRLNWPIADLVLALQRQSTDHGPKVVTLIMTGREDLCDESGWTIMDLTSSWLMKNNIHFDDLFIRRNGDHRPDFEVKKDMYDLFVKDIYNVLYVIDDRKQVIDMWRSLGLTVLDVAGNDF